MKKLTEISKVYLTNDRGCTILWSNMPTYDIDAELWYGENGTTTIHLSDGDAAALFPVDLNKQPVEITLTQQL